MFRGASLFIGTYFTVAVFTIFATSNVDSIVDNFSDLSLSVVYSKLVANILRIFYVLCIYCWHPGRILAIG